MPFRPETSAPPPATFTDTLHRLAALAATSPPAIPAGNELEQVEAVLSALAPALRATALPGSLLARVVGDARFDGEPSERALPKPARAALKKGQAFASSDADIWLVAPNGDGTWFVGHAHPESYREVAPTLTAWLAQEADAIAAARAPKPKKAAKQAEGKPAIDASLARLAALGGHDVAPILTTVKATTKMTRWDYTLTAVKACGPAWSEAVLAKLDGRLLGRVLAGKLDDTDDETCIVEEDDDELDGVNPIYVKRYPKAARSLLTSGHFIASSGPEVWLLTRDAKGAQMNWGITLYHAAPDGFEQIATSIEAWLEVEVRRVEATLGA